MRSILLGAAAALGLFPVLASAAVVTVNTGLYNTADGTVPTTAVSAPIIPGPAEQRIIAEIFAVDNDPADATAAEQERLNTVTIRLLGGGFSTTTGGSAPRFNIPGATFGTAGRPTHHPYVFADLESIPAIENFGSQPNRLQFGITAPGQEDEADIINTGANGTGKSGFLKLPIIIPANATPGTYTITVDLAGSQLAGRGAPINLTAGQAATFTIVPEPASLGLIVLGGLLTLRRRRVA